MELWNHLCPGCMREIKEKKAAGIGKDERNTEKSTGRGHGQADFRCPHCGFSESEYKQNPRCLPLNTILAGKYLVGKVLGEGGFGITYMGYDLNMKARIAIKEYFPVELVSRDTTRLTSPDGKAVSGGGNDCVISLSGEKSKTYQQGLKKYVDEARNVSRFAGIPGIVSVKDFFYENDTAYIVMEYIEGISLKEYLKQKGGKVSEEEALAILRPVLEALEKVHAAGIVHRDISPDNIMLTFAEQGEVEKGKAEQSASSHKLSDSASIPTSTAVYGNISAVKLIDFGAARMTTKNDQKSLTIILKHGYAPEEQYRSHGEQGPWTDVYALCAVLYRMLTGKVPEPAMDRLFSDGLKRPEELGVKVSPAVSEAIMRGLAVKKEDRIRSVRELMDALYAGKKLKKHRNGKLPRQALIAALAVGVLVLALAAAGITGALRTGYGAADTSAVDASTEGQEKGGGIVENADAGLQTAVGGSAEAGLSLEKETEVFGETIVTWSPQTSMAAGERHVLAAHEDGTVEALGANTEGQTEVEGWKRIAAVAAGDTFSAGLREDGTLITAGALEAADEVERWEKVVEIAADGTMLFALTQDGIILSNQKYGETGDYYEWEDVVHIACSNHGLSALTGDGTVRNYIPRETEYGSPAIIEGWTDVEHLIAAQYAVFGITESGDIRSAVILDAVPEDYYNFTGLDAFHGISAFYSAAGLTQYGVREDGSLCIGGFTADSEMQPVFERMSGWKDLQSFMGVDYQRRYVGLKRDGSLVTEEFHYGNSTPETMKNLEWIGFLNENDLVGVTKDKKALTYGKNTDLWAFDGVSGICQVRESSGFQYQIDGYLCLDQNGRMTNLTNMPGASSSPAGETFVWEGVGQMAGPPTNGAFAVGLFEDGTVRLLLADWYEEQWENPRVAETWTGISQIACTNSSIVGLHDDGTVQGVTLNGEEIPRFADWTDIAAIFSGPDVGAIRKDGTAVIDRPEDNEYGQKNVSGWENLTQLAMSERHTVGLRADGTVVAVGSNASGQCDVEDWTDIVFVAAGGDCTLGIRSDGSLAIAGIVGW